MRLLKPLVFTFLLFASFSCKKSNTEFDPTDAVVSKISLTTARAAAAATLAVLTENFETGTKAAYAAANVTLSTGSWNLNDALLGNSTSDRKNGTQSARVRNSGILTTNFDFSTGASTVTVLHALFGTDANSTWQLWYSTNGGTSYSQSGSTITTSSTTLQTASFTINISGNIRFQIRKTDGSSNRINFDDFAVTSYSGSPANPTLTSVAPASVFAGSPAFTITATGTNFTNTSTINWNGTALATSFVSATSLTATVPAANIVTAGVDSITISTAGAGTSTALAFTVQNPPAPTLNSISPNTAIAGGISFTLTATGSNFTNASIINWNGTALTTAFVSATSLTATVPSAKIVSAGTDSITVSTTGIGTSAALAFTVQNPPAPILNSISPNTAVAGGTSFTLTATGSNFINTSVINWNGSAFTTAYVNSTTLTASVPAANITTAGTASVTVTTPGANASAAVTFTITPQTSGAKRFLFDATKAETAGNADWVIDEDGGSPQRIPTPAQSTITSSTAETYWTGALSSWGIALVKSGNSVETLPSGTAITYGNTGNPQDLSNYNVFVVDEPNIRFTAAEKTAILNFVNNGGGLFMISDHTVSDRNNDGWDSPAIWNDLMTNNTVQNNPFGFSIDLTNISQISTNVLSNSSSNPILNGVKGTVTKLQFNNGATLTLQPSVNSTVQGLIWQNTYTQGNTHVMAASSTFGAGRVFVVTDSSPMDDGTGASGNNLFVSWPLYSHTQLFMNASLWLAKLQ